VSVFSAAADTVAWIRDEGGVEDEADVDGDAVTFGGGRADPEDQSTVLLEQSTQFPLSRPVQ
jgi:hypothetical protein